MEQFALMIYQGTTPLPGTDEWEALPQDGADPGLRRLRERSTRRPASRPGPPLGLPSDARTVVVKDGTVDVREGAHLGTDGAVGGFLVLEADDLDAADRARVTDPGGPPRRRHRDPAGGEVLVIGRQRCPRRDDRRGQSVYMFSMNSTAIAAVS